ncbi:M10 family metallopeptidase C-terminal domain-containing protein [Yersinia enterocolitica]|uniref:M10 family metallopeptidase C-terminal domain-containing protein n=1 Tax=Yersinia enterocolitica TaxID=630 RepID=UPI0029BEE937|nr:peptidase M10 [Yersinia enterocolitica]HEI6721590.1 M10 family metallopeptidase [Yersinia enterocolitica]HEI6785094.1 M10 family metallopeptidase [Yersinia enterocolitica]HEI6822682.1 M10 family metallopeptidase [Yersinia enterocolitica]HEI6881811.1 M10 family metallopeptidase [Yersinia enterocolitica]
MEEIRNVIDNKLRNIKHATIPYNEKWKTKKSDSIPVVTYSFPQSIPSNYYYYELNHKIPISSLNQLQIDQAKSTFRNISDVANISFTEVKYTEVKYTEVNIPIVNFHPENYISVGGFAYYPNAGEFTPVCINADVSENLAPTHLNSGGHVIVHELLHAVGLKHTHNTVQLTQQYSVMSYLSEQYSDANYGEYHVSTPQLYDIDALQYLYGANMNTRIGNDIYTYSSNTPILCIWDAGGIDTFDFSDQTQDLVINLAAGSFSNVGRLTGNISIAYGTTIENAVGGRGDDKIIGNDADNILTGGYGADQLWGKNGRNIFYYLNTKESTTTAADTLHDFNVNKDKIDLSPLIYANDNVALVDRFSFSGQTEIMQKYDEIRNITYLMIDFDNNVHETDMMIKLTGKHQLLLNNFIVNTPLIA